MSSTPLKIAVLFGSYRPERSGFRAVKYLERNLKERGLDVIVVDAKEENLPILSRTYREYKPDTLQADEKDLYERLKRISQVLQNADGYVAVAGEYNHSTQPGLKNLIDHFMPEYFYKACGIATYSIGSFGGARGLVNLRGVLGEVGLVSVPTVHYFPQVTELLDEKGMDPQGRLTKQTKKFIDDLIWYAEALKAARSKN